jgi:hypothetical protein
VCVCVCERERERLTILSVSTTIASRMIRSLMTDDLSGNGKETFVFLRMD